MSDGLKTGPCALDLHYGKLGQKIVSNKIVYKNENRRRKEKESKKKKKKRMNVIDEK